jgi:hypothetical protein
MRFPLLFASLLFSFVGSQTAAAQRNVCQEVVSQPMTVEGNAPIVTLNFKRLDGTLRPARFLFDSGGGATILDESLARDLRLTPRAQSIEQDGARFAPTTPPFAQLGSTTIALSTSKAFIHLGSGSFDTRERVEGMLPGKALEPYQVVLDYPLERFTISPAGCLKHHGVKVSSPFLPESGHPKVVVSVESKTYGLLLDTGCRATLARRDLLESLSATHPSWPHLTGAAGTADMPGANGTEFLLRVPEISWGPFHIKNVLFVSRPNETFSYTMFETPTFIVGALGGNVLKHFRIEIDYPHGTTYLEQKSGDAGGDMNSAGLVLDVDTTEGLVVRAIDSAASATTKMNIRVGDQIIAIDGKREMPWTIVDASDMLSGAPGETKRLVIRRAGKEMQTTVIVADLL